MASDIRGSACRIYPNAEVIFCNIPCFFFQRMSTSPANTDEVLLERIGTAGVITMTRPKVLNSLNLSMIRTMYPQLKVPV